MQLCIHRGAKEIGGNCIELQSKGQSLLLDLGMPLSIDNQAEVQLPPVKGLKDGGHPDFLGIVISHPHQDHYGLLPQVHPNTPVYIGQAAHAILEASAPFSPSGLSLNNVIHYEHHIPFDIGPFRLTPYLVDHSAFDAYSLLIEADGKQLFYTGDFRAHGRKSSTFKQLLEQGPKDVDVLLMEGTNIGRPSGEVNPKTEDELEDNIGESIMNTKGLVLSWFSGQNIDRFVTFYKAAKRAGRTVVVDLYIAHILDALGKKTIPTPGNSDLRVFLPSRMRNRIIRDKNFKLVEPYYHKRIYPEEIKERASELVMTFRPSMVSDLEKAQCLDNATMIYSMWSGYLERGVDIRDWCQEHEIDFKIHHTSGHADLPAMKKLVGALSPERLVPIHSMGSDQYPDFFKNVKLSDDGQWLDV